MSFEQWRGKDWPAHGVAYGFEDLPRALASAPRVLERLRALQAANGPTARRMVQQCAEFFDFPF